MDKNYRVATAYIIYYINVRSKTSKSESKSEGEKLHFSYTHDTKKKTKKKKDKCQVPVKPKILLRFLRFLRDVNRPVKLDLC